MQCIGGSHAHQGQTADQYHGDHRSLKIFVLYQAERFDPEVGPALPEGRVLVPRHAGEVEVALDWTAVRRVLSQHHLLGVHIQHKLRLHLHLHIIGNILLACGFRIMFYPPG